MNHSRPPLRVVALVLALLSLANGAHAVQPGAPLSLDEAAAMVRERVGGKVVRAETRDEPAGRVYEFRVVSEDGRVRTVRVDAATGAIR